MTRTSKKSEGAFKRWANPEARAKQAKMFSAVTTERWADPVKRAALSQNLADAWASRKAAKSAASASEFVRLGVPADLLTTTTSMQEKRVSRMLAKADPERYAALIAHYQIEELTTMHQAIVIGWMLLEGRHLDIYDTRKTTYRWWFNGQ